MSNAPPETHYPDWAAALISPASQDAAIAAFLVMARVESNSNDKSPSMRVVNPYGGSDSIYLEFDLRDPNAEGNEEGNQDHVLFKGPDDTDKRANKGKRDSADYQEERAARIRFIPKTLKDKNVRVYRCTEKSKRLVYTCRTGPDEHFLVFVHEILARPRRLAFVTAYFISDEEFMKKTREEWERMYPKANRPPKRRKK